MIASAIFPASRARRVGSRETEPQRKCWQLIGLSVSVIFMECSSDHAIQKPLKGPGEDFPVQIESHE